MKEFINRGGARVGVFPTEDDAFKLVMARDPFTHQMGARVMEVTLNQLVEFYEGKIPVQTVFPNLDADEREYLMTGIVAESWNEAFPPEDKE